jgi:hypothetical protein
MKLRQFIIPIIIFLAGTSFGIIGGLFKILHWGLGYFNGSVLIATGSFLEVIGIAIIIVILLRHYFKKDNL